MAPNAPDSNAVLFESDAVTDDLALNEMPIQQADNTRLVYYIPHIIVVPLLYLAGLYGGYLFLVAAKWQTNVFALVFHVISMISLTAGAHRLWSHRSYKANRPLKFLLLFFQTVTMQYSMISWVRDHRMHHKYADTDADPHNAMRGAFFAHVGWTLVYKHPEYRRKLKQLDLSDVYSDPMLRFQHKYYLPLMLLTCIILPTLFPVYFWNESWANSFFVAAMFRPVLTYNITLLINSLAHNYGHKPYDKNIRAADNALLYLPLFGDGFHNYHHVFPWDYRGAELGSSVFNLTATLIDFFAKIGWASDLKTVPDEIIRKRVERTGDGSHVNWGWGRKQSNEEKDTSVRMRGADSIFSFFLKE